MAGWIPPGWMPANPPEDVRPDGKVASQYGCGVALLIMLVVFVIIGLVVFVLVEPLP